jgi:hypothetical protein
MRVVGEVGGFGAVRLRVGGNACLKEEACCVCRKQVMYVGWLAEWNSDRKKEREREIDIRLIKVFPLFLYSGLTRMKRWW